MPEIRIKAPIRTVSELNSREHWAARYRRRSKQREALAWLLKSKPKPKPPADVFLTRIAPRKLDTDNLASAFKALRDQLADWLGIDDGDPCVKWHYDQRKGEPKEYAVLIEVLTDET